MGNYLVCKAVNASESINGIAFQRNADGYMVSVEIVPDDVGSVMATIPDFELLSEEKVEDARLKADALAAKAAKAAAKSAPTAAAPAPVLEAAPEPVVEPPAAPVAADAPIPAAPPEGAA